MPDTFPSPDPDTEHHTLDLTRPYVNQSTSAALGSVVEDLDVTGEVGGPYFLTRGRTTSYSEDITFETMVVVADLPSPHIHALRFEERQLVRLCRYEPQSVWRSPQNCGSPSPSHGCCAAT
ncbi:MAG: hypothetical protein R2715_10595 [Ilumatobacteraceae bacterium]